MLETGPASKGLGGPAEQHRVGLIEGLGRPRIRQRPSQVQVRHDRRLSPHPHAAHRLTEDLHATDHIALGEAVAEADGPVALRGLQNLVDPRRHRGALAAQHLGRHAHIEDEHHVVRRGVTGCLVAQADPIDEQSPDRNPEGGEHPVDALRRHVTVPEPTDLGGHPQGGRPDQEAERQHQRRDCRRPPDRPVLTGDELGQGHDRHEQRHIHKHRPQPPRRKGGVVPADLGCGP